MEASSTSAATEGLLQKESQGVKFRNVLALFVWLGAIHVDAVFCLVCICFLPNPWAITALGLWVATIFIPTFVDSKFANNLATFVAKNAPNHFPMEVHVEDMDAFDPNRSYVLAVEPHSVLPISIVVLTTHYGLMPFTKVKACATTIIFWTPVLRHIWTWMGLIPASKSSIRKHLHNGYSTILIPGGVQECLYLKQGQETIFLKRRLGFLRLAMEAGSPLVPCFCFGQSEVYHYWKPSGEWFAALSRAIGFTPLVFWGMYGSPVPYPHPMYFVVGKPIEVEKISDPSKEQVIALQEKFIKAMGELFERHKSRAGYSNYTLHVKLDMRISHEDDQKLLAYVLGIFSMRTM
ncbi:unnamed protein product [Calypogeia fissa]